MAEFCLTHFVYCKNDVRGIMWSYIGRPLILMRFTLRFTSDSQWDSYHIHKWKALTQSIQSKWMALEYARLVQPRWAAAEETQLVANMKQQKVQTNHQKQRNQQSVKFGSFIKSQSFLEPQPSPNNQVHIHWALIFSWSTSQNEPSLLLRTIWCGIACGGEKVTLVRTNIEAFAFFELVEIKRTHFFIVFIVGQTFQHISTLVVARFLPHRGLSRTHRHLFTARRATASLCLFYIAESPSYCLSNRRFTQPMDDLNDVDQQMTINPSNHGLNHQINENIGEGNRANLFSTVIPLNL